MNAGRGIGGGVVAGLLLLAVLPAQQPAQEFDACIAKMRAAPDTREQSRLAVRANQWFLRLDSATAAWRQRVPAALQAAVLAGRPERALELADKAEAVTPAAVLLRWRLHALALHGDLPAFVAALPAPAPAPAMATVVDEVLTAREGTLLPLADRAMRAGDTATGRTVFAALAKLQPAQAYRFANLGLCLRSLGEPEAAEQAYLRARELAPNDAQIENDYGLFLRATGRRQEALAAFRRSHALDEAVPGGKRGLGPAITNLLHLEALSPGACGSDPVPASRQALALRPGARMLRRLLLDVSLARLDR